MLTSPNVVKIAPPFTASWNICVSEQHTLSKPHMLLTEPPYVCGSSSPLDAFTRRGTQERPSSEGGPPPAQHSGPLGLDALHGCGAGSVTKAHLAAAGRGSNAKASAQRVGNSIALIKGRQGCCVRARGPRDGA